MLLRVGASAPLYSYKRNRGSKSLTCCGLLCLRLVIKRLQALQSSEIKQAFDNAYIWQGMILHIKLHLFTVLLCILGKGAKMCRMHNAIFHLAGRFEELMWKKPYCNLASWDCTATQNIFKIFKVHKSGCDTSLHHLIPCHRCHLSSLNFQLLSAD